MATIIGRFPVQTTGANGVIRQSQPVRYADSNFTIPILPGLSVRFQGWYTDANGPCGSLFNTSNVVEVQFVP